MQKDPGKAKKIVTIDSVVYITKIHNSVYFTNMHQADKQENLLVYGANEGMTIADMTVIKRGENDVMANNSDDYTAQDLSICTVVAQVHPYKRSTIPIILIMHQFDYFGKGKTIYPSSQIKFYNYAVDDKLSEEGGKQHIMTFDGYTIPSDI